MNRLLLPLLFTLGLLTSACSIQAVDGDWLTDFDKAKEKAQKESKLVLLDFTGSDWCPPCKALHRNVFSKAEFLEYAKDNLVLVEIDFPRRKPQSPELRRANSQLAKQFEIEGYPTVVVTDASGKKLSSEVGYQGDTAESFLEKMKKIKGKLD